MINRYSSFIKRILKIEQIPPVLVVLSIPLYVLFVVSHAIGWFTGFWYCQHCNNVRWINTKKNQVTILHETLDRWGDKETYETYEKHCDSCVVANKLSS